MNNIVRRSRWFLVALHLPFLIGSPLYVAAGVGAPAGNAAPAFALAAVAVLLQLRHSFAAARDERPAGWPWTLLALTVVTVVPTLWWSWNWAAMSNLAIASAAMLLRGRPAIAATLIPTLLISVAAIVDTAREDATAFQTVYIGIFWLSSTIAVSGSLYGAARLVHALDELYAARTELAEAAIGQERGRVSRDLHDLLGQSLSAVSLKGDLAIRLLPRDTDKARAEIESLTGLARTALHDVRAVTRDEHAVSLRQEIDAAAGLLEAAGVAARIEARQPDLDQPGQDVLAWAVREGTTNLLRHSQAQTCAITVDRDRDTVRLEIVNDGVRVQPAGTGSGLDGLAERARAIGGSVSAGITDNGRFRLLVEVPRIEQPLGAA